MQATEFALQGSQVRGGRACPRLRITRPLELLQPLQQGPCVGVIRVQALRQPTGQFARCGRAIGGDARAPRLASGPVQQTR